MASVSQLLPLIIAQNVGRQKLARTPEPDSVTAEALNVLQYDRVLETKLAIPYAIMTETIYRLRPKLPGGRALDLACGPGHLSIMMAKELKLNELVGVDLSAPMIETASRNGQKKRLNNVRFQTGDATDLTDFAEAEFDLTTMSDAAHHIPSLALVTQVLQEMERVTKPDGLIVVMDLVRLRTKELTEKYVHMFAHDYADRDLAMFQTDFYNSMYAAWTPDELSSAVPTESHRKWSIVVPRPLPFAQFLIGMPATQTKVFLHRDRLWKSSDLPITPRNRSDYRTAKMSMAAASVRSVALNRETKDNPGEAKSRQPA